MVQTIVCEHRPGTTGRCSMCGSILEPEVRHEVPGLRSNFRFVRMAWWPVAVLTVIGGAEYSVRYWLENHPKLAPYWEKKTQEFAASPVDFFFIGSSRVAAAVDTESFDSAVHAKTAKAVRSLNLGLGSSTMQEHFLALRNWSEQHPGCLRGRSVFIEAPAGVADHGGINEAKTWHNPQQPDLLLPLLKVQDLPDLWSNKMALEDKLQLTAGFVLRDSRLFTHGNMLAHKAMAAGEKRFSGIVRKIWRAPTERAAAVADLAAAGGIQNEQEAVDRSRRIAIEMFAKGLENLKAREASGPPSDLPNLDQSVLKHLVQFVAEQGGQVVFFDMPIHSAQAAAGSTKTGQRERAAFQNHARAWGTPIVTADFTYGDDDFPDVWHLRKSRASGFSEALATAWISRAP